MKKIILVIGLIILCFHSSMAQDNQELIQNITRNSWEGNGTLMGVAATFQMNWELVLDTQFLRLDFSSTRRGADGSKINFRAHGYYKINKSKITGTWFDSRGVASPLTGEIDKNKLIILWGTDKTEQGKTVYTLVDMNEISIKDYILKDGSYTKFGEADYNRL